MASQEAQPVSWRARPVRPTRPTTCRTSSRQGMVMIRDGGSSENTRRPSSSARRGETESFSTMAREIAKLCRKPAIAHGAPDRAERPEHLDFPLDVTRARSCHQRSDKSRYAFGHTQSGNPNCASQYHCCETDLSPLYCVSAVQDLASTSTITRKNPKVSDRQRIERTRNRTTTPTTQALHGP